MKDLDLKELEQVVGGDLTSPPLPSGTQAFLDQQASNTAAALAVRIGAGQIR